MYNVTMSALVLKLDKHDVTASTILKTKIKSKIIFKWYLWLDFATV